MRPRTKKRRRRAFGKVDRPKMTEDFVASAMWLKNRPDSTGKLGAVGFCFGGGIVNTLAVRLGADLAAGVPFYGAVPPEADIPKIKAAMLIHHGEADTRLAATWPAYDAALTAASVTHEGFIYPGAQHGFNNDTTPRYERSDRQAGLAAHDRLVQRVRARLVRRRLRKRFSGDAGFLIGSGVFVLRGELAFAVLEEFDLAQALFGFGFGLVGAAKVLALFGQDLVTAFDFLDHVSSPGARTRCVSCRARRMQ